MLAGILGSRATIDSDYELSELLRQIVAQQTLDDRNRAAFFGAVATHRQRLRAPSRADSAVDRAASAPSDRRLLEAALARPRSLHQRLRSRRRSCRRCCGRTASRGACARRSSTSSRGIDPDYERGRVLQAVVRKADASDDTLRAVLQAARRDERLRAVAGAEGDGRGPCTR